MNDKVKGIKKTSRNVHCPYCGKSTKISYPENYAPVVSRCSVCGKEFIMERRAHGLEVFTRESSPYCSDPDCLAIEMGGSDEQ